MKSIAFKCIQAVFALWLAAGAGAQEVRGASVTTQLEPNPISVGQGAVLKLIFEGASPNSHPSLPAIPGLQIRPSGKSTSMNIVGLQRSIQHTFQYTVIPEREGRFVIPGMQFRVGNETIASQSVTLNVLPSGSAGTGPKLDQWARLEMKVEKSQVYVGQKFPVTIMLYYRNLQDANLPNLESEGFTFGQMAKPVEGNVLSNGVRYNTYRFDLTATAVKAGELTLGPATCEVRIPVRSRSRSLFNLAFPQSREARLVSDSRSLQVLPLPENERPENFRGAIGNFRMRVEVVPKAVTVGDPITVQVKIGGTGTIDSLELPEQKAWADFKTYPPTSSVEISDQLGMSGVKTFEQVIIPQHAEISSLPAMEFSYFDPNSGKYVSLQSEPVPLEVEPGEAVGPQPTLGLTTSKDRPPKRPSDIVHIKSRPGAMAEISAPLVCRPAFLALQAIPMLGWLTVLGWRKRREFLAENPRLVRRKNVLRRVRSGMEELRKLAAENRGEEFVSLVYRLLQEQIGERLDLPASAITAEVVDDKLARQGAPENLRHRLHELFEICDQSRFAPLATPQDLESLRVKTEAVLTEMQRLSS